MTDLYFYDAARAEDYPPSGEQLAAFPAFYAERYRTARAETVRQQAAGSAVLLAQVCGVISDDQLIRGEQGQIALKDDPRHIGLSHSGPLTVLAVSDVPVGVDLERVHESSEPTVRRLFPPSFREEMEEVPDASRDETFTRLWTRLEAALKLDGRGLAVPRDEFETLLRKSDLRTEKTGDYYITVATPKRS